MKNLLIAVLLLMGYAASGQVATVVYKDGSHKTVKIISSANTELNTDAGTIKFDELTSVAIPYEDKNLAEKLHQFGVMMLVDGNEVKVTTPLYLKPNVTEDVSMRELSESIERFRVQRTNGKVLQLLGVVAVGAGLIIATGDSPKINTIKPIYIGGTILSTVGFIIDLDAGNRLKRKR